MIKRLKYHEIDFEKYSRSIENSVQKNFYAKKEILDQLCEEWQLLIKDDYDFVMPVPIKKKYALEFVLMPLFCQQLGVFGKEINEKTEQEFLDFFCKNYRIVNYSFNFRNTFLQDIKRKKNYYIEKSDYKTLRKYYFKGRKSTVKSAQYLHFKEVELSDVRIFIRENFKGLQKISDVEKFFRYLNFLQEKQQLKLFGSFKDCDLTNLAILIDDGKTYALLGLINNEKFRSDNGASFLIDRILQETIHQKSFDFMGGGIRGIEVFFKSFGAALQEYSVIENSKKELFKKVLRMRF
ncbi:MAG: hypothetical protein QM564_07495 [Bergeyella sp.]